jgi:hypothetical protein
MLVASRRQQRDAEKLPREALAPSTLPGCDQAQDQEQEWYNGYHDPYGQDASLNVDIAEKSNIRNQISTPGSRW